VIRAVIDTNIIVSGLLWAGTPELVLDAAVDDRFQPISSKPLIAELEQTLQKKKLQPYIEHLGFTPEQIADWYSKLVTIVEATELPMNAVRDSDDVVVLGTAVAGRCTAIITGDKDLLTLQTYERIQIVRASEFIDILNRSDS
jgi:putative PIN family toxin of toxin-antitoxin system